MFRSPLLLFTFLSILGYAQQTHIQDIFHGGVTASGYSSCLGSGIGDIDIYIEPGSTIKKATLYSYRIGKETPSSTIKFNNLLITFSELTRISINVENGNLAYGPDFSTHAVDVTNIISVSQLSYQIENLDISPFPCANCVYGAFYLVVSYENPSLSKVSYSSFVNNIENQMNIDFSFAGINTIDKTNPVSLALHSDRLSDTSLSGGNYIDINNVNIGLIGGGDNSDTPADCGVKGSFYYQNNQLYGLDDDTADSVMYTSDALADIKSYLNPNSLGFDLSLTHQTSAAVYKNFFSSFHLAYTTPCDTFSTSVSEQVTICEGDTAFLTANGGNSTLSTAYEWEPQEGLSCYNCPNPYYTDTLSKWYTVRIWNTDSCSKVIPVNIHVNVNPPSPIVATSTTQCSDSTGVALVTVVDATYTYSANNSTPQISNGLSYLWGGNHLITVTDTNGCTADTIVNVPVYYPTAHFTASPLQGDVPLEVTFTNTSFNATYYVWYIDNDTLSSTNPTYTFNESGQFSATLIAYDTYPQCADTASISIFAEYPFTVFSPSFYAYQEDLYTIYTSGVKELNYTLYNSIGQQMYSTSYTNNTDAAQYLSLWSGYDLARGTYLYRIVAKGLDGTEKVFSGKVVLM